MFMRPFSLLLFSGISRKAFCQRFVNFRNRIAICRPRRHGLLEFLADGHGSTALKERKEHKRSFPAYWIVEVLPPKPAFTDSRGNRHRHLLYFGHSPPYQGRIACGQSSVLVFEWEWCAIDKDLTPLAVQAFQRQLPL